MAGDPTVEDVNRAAARALILEVINQGDLARFDELVAEDYVDHTDKPPIQGRDAYRELVVETRKAFPDLQMSIEDEVVEGDRVAMRLRWRATHDAEFLGVPATGRPIEMDGIGILRFRDGQLIERWNVSDLLGVLEQLKDDQPA